MVISSIKMSSEENVKNHNLILPNGDEVDLEIFKSCGYKISEYMKRYESSPENSSKVCLNKLDQAQSKAVCEQFFDGVADDNMILDPEKVVRMILTELIDEILASCSSPILADDMIQFNQSENIQKILKKTHVLRNIHLTKLLLTSEITCFLVNLTNLMFLHALICHSNKSGTKFISTDWAYQQIYFHSVGYFVGRLGFVSLFDLHCFLFNFPTTSIESNLSSLEYSADPRLSFCIAQPYAFSPKINVVHPEAIDEYLKSSEIEYLNFCSVINTNRILTLPIPLLLQVEKTYFENKSVPRYIQNSQTIREKIISLIELLGNDSQSFAEVMENGALLVKEAQFTVHFSYCDSASSDLQSYRQVLWKFCCYHVSFIHCVADFISAVETALYENFHREFPSANHEEVKTKVQIIDIFKKIDIFAARFTNEFSYDVDNCPENMRCLYNVLLFTTSWCASAKVAEDTVFDNIILMLQTIANDDKFSVPETFSKIQACEKVLMLDQHIRSKWSSWYDVFIEEPSTVLSVIVEQQNVSVAVEFVDAQNLNNPFYEFDKQVYASFLSLLCLVPNIDLLANYVSILSESQLIEIVDILIEGKCQVLRLNTLVSGILLQPLLSESGWLKFYTLWLGLRMVTNVSENEQISFYEILHYPKLIVEQLIINKCTGILKTALKATKNSVTDHRMAEEIDTGFRNDVDALLMQYAEKALYFSKSPFANSNRQSDQNKPKKITFTPPKKVPTVEQWVPDEKASKCLLCARRFTVFTRRHHCRRCGQIFCYFCSTRRIKINSYDEEVRVCDSCYDFEKPVEVVSGNIGNSENSIRSQVFWRLSPDESANHNIRHKAAFETGPDIVLCMELVELHTPDSSLARFVFRKAEEMTKILRHRLVFSANFNYDEVTACARSLTYAAKILFAGLNDGHGIRRCEEMASEIELLNLCSSIDYVPDDPNRPMRDVDQWNIIKDRLTNLGEWKKALEIASKIGADTKSIWFLWGISLIKSGDWKSAREKIKFSSIKKNSSEIKEILEAINSSPNGPKFEEGLHYIHNYANPEIQYQYFVHYNKIGLAVDAALSDAISPEVFVDTLFMPLVRSGEYHDVLQSMKNIDPSLLYWKEHIKLMCDRCQRENYSSVLYDVQKWVGDHFRAAISCSKFYKRNCHTYSDLLKNSEWLSQAICHLNSYQKQPEEKRFKLPEKKPPIERYLEILHWQIKITSIICSDPITAVMKFKTVPTLLGQPDEQTEVICLLFFAMDAVEKAFLLTIEIVTKNLLDFCTVYTKVALSLMRAKREEEVKKLVTLIEEKSSQFEATSADTILLAILELEPEDSEHFVSLINHPEAKVIQLMKMDRLMTAYKFATGLEKPAQLLKKIRDEAVKRNCSSVALICERRLQAEKSSQ